MVDLIDENGRLFGLVNIIDLLVVLLVVAMVAAGFALVSGSSPDSDAEDAQPTTTVVFESQSVEPYVAAAIQNGSVGGPEVMAVRSKTVEPATVVVPDQNGQLHVRQHPRLKDVTLTLELNTTRKSTDMLFSDVIHSGSGPTVRKRPLRIGQQLRLDVGNVTLTGNVTSIGG
ncbi:DUF4330 domain-containing protein [Halorientalis brevis]|uniref:DUF4330 domain-containing protein n=1 Tax=Halorientalis brevis TaxID=1126241 RepID=A0ABD6CCB3_9EURY|nr:DUF4330 domain-containing protein [Halorientalis brevis]